jgi:nucleoside-diphosphate-sugar epimerase
LDRNPSRTVLVTGAEGFVGQGLLGALEKRGFEVRGTARTACVARNVRATGDMASFDRWHDLVRGVDAVVHLAGRAHIMSRRVAGGVEAYRPVNVDATLRLAKAAVCERVRRFVFVSSIGVHGNASIDGPLTERNAPAPVEPYAISKLEAEQALTSLLAGSELELVIVRPTLVYGPGAKGNFQRLLKLAASGVPMPFGSLRAPKSFIGRDNLCDLLITCVEHPAAAGQVFLAAEPERQSTARMYEAIARHMPQAGRIWRCPPRLLRLIAAGVGKRPMIDKLSLPLEADPSKSIELLGWRPVRSFESGIAESADWFMAK